MYRYHPTFTVSALLVSWFALAAAAVQAGELPEPKVGLVVTRDEVVGIRAKIQSGFPQKIWAGFLKEVTKAVEMAKALRASSWPQAGTAGTFGTAMDRIRERYLECVPVIATHYLVTGQTDGVDDALWCMRQLRNYERLGWFAWSGGSFPTIGFGGMVRVTSYTYDWLYGAMDEATRKDVEAYLVMAGRDYFRTDLIGPGMAAHHLRSLNQGDNAFCSGLAATLATRNVNPDSAQWLRAYMDTYIWNLNSAFGPNGQDLEGNLGAYEARGSVPRGGLGLTRKEKE